MPRHRNHSGAAGALIPLLAVTLLCTSLLVVPTFADKTESGMVTAAMRANAIRNVERYQWAQETLEELKERVAPYMEMSPEELWLLLPSQEMGRDARGYHHAHGFPQCLLEHEGAELGRGRWKVRSHASAH